ncbi:MAG TPA: DNA recombination protein RmuC, partial [Burkholderiaceae bacterium]|nr:DNA recombination protein RmuC [Burkholderiaceae bacterium]
QAQSLSTALRGESKTAGNWGEMLLERCLQLAGLEKGLHYRVQPSYATGAGQRLQPDIVVDLPDQKSIVIDSKVSLADYDLAVSSTSDEESARFLDAHVRAVRRHVDDLARKGYARLPGADSPGFVLMYMPIEAAAMAALRHSSDLVEYAWRKDVMLVSTSTLMPVLRLIAAAWATDRTHREAGELARQAGDIHAQMARVAERFRRLGATLGTANRHYNDTVTALAGQQGLVRKISRFAGLASQAQQDMPALHALSDDYADADHTLEQVRESPENS